jgi:hypothetical protein
MDSPLLILRTPVQRRDTVFDDRVFLPDVFFDRVRRAVAEGLPELAPEGPPPRTELASNRLARAETYYQGATEGKVLPGACGSIDLALDEPLGLPWARALLVCYRAACLREDRAGCVMEILGRRGVAPAEGWFKRAGRVRGDRR